MTDWIARAEDRIKRYATDQDMRQAEWEVLGARVAMDAIRLLAVAKVAERLVTAENAQPWGLETPIALQPWGAGPACYWCGGGDGEGHATECPWQALVAALQAS
jgi:hypothetical protein